MASLVKVMLLGAAGIATVAVLAVVAIYSPAAREHLGRAVSEKDVDITRDVPYGALDRQALDIYRPKDDDGSSPVVVFIYGGSWRYGSRSLYGFVGAALAARGITAVIADYRLFPDVKFPAFVEDAALAYQWVSENLAPPRADRRPIILMGHSAGAHIAALLAYDPRYVGPDARRPDAFIGLAGPYAFDPTTWETTAEIFTAAKSADEARPVTFVSPGAPPSLLFHGLSDGLVKLWNTRYLAEALTEHGVPVRKVELDGIGHLGVLLAIARPLRWRAPVLDEIVAFVGRVEPREWKRSVAGASP